MKYLLAAAQGPVLERFARTRLLLAFDFDGTLAPIVRDPDRAAMRPSTRRLLIEAARLYPCAVISGRSRADALRRLAGVPMRAVIGNHGAETGGRPSPAERRRARDVRRWQAALGRVLAAGGDAFEGVWLEDKRLSLAIHYRRARHRPEARRAILEAILEAIAPLGRARVVGGKYVVNLVPAGSPDKGAALDHLRARLACDHALYVGDDDTDEAAFASHRRRRLLAVRIGSRADSHAGYCLRDQREIDRLLAALIELHPVKRLATAR
jgi:trehalose 6-phosphate phosphatase